MDNRYIIESVKHDKIVMEVSCSAMFEMTVREACVLGPEGRFYLSTAEDAEGNNVYRSDESKFSLLIKDYLTPAEQRLLAEKKVDIKEMPELTELLERIVGGQTANGTARISGMRTFQ